MFWSYTPSIMIEFLPHQLHVNSHHNLINMSTLGISLKGCICLSIHPTNYRGLVRQRARILREREYGRKNPRVLWDSGWGWYLKGSFFLSLYYLKLCICLGKLDISYLCWGLHAFPPISMLLIMWVSCATQEIHSLCACMRMHVCALACVSLLTRIPDPHLNLVSIRMSCILPWYVILSCWRQGFNSFNEDGSRGIEVEAGNSSVPEEAENVESPLARHRSRRFTSGASETAKGGGEMVDSPASSPEPHYIAIRTQHNGDAFHSEEVSFNKMRCL